MFNDDDYEIPDEIDPARMMSLEQLRDHALELFDDYIAKASGGVNPEARTATMEEKARFLTIDEAEQIVQEFSDADNGEVMAVGGRSPHEAAVKIMHLMQALMTRIMSNVVAAGVNAGYIDSCFDDEANAFSFSVSKLGFEFVEKNRHMFSDTPEFDDDNDDETTSNN